MDESNISLLVEAKTEYTNQLINLLHKPIYDGIKSVYEESIDFCKNNQDSENELKTFQKLLSRIPQWNQEIIDNECSRIINVSNCSWIEDLLSAVFISHTRVLTNFRSKHKINLVIPTFSTFIHKTYIVSARQFWKNPYLFSNENVSQFEFQKNLREIENIISTSINETIRLLLPVKTILKEYLGNDYDDDIGNEDITYDKNDHIRKMVEMETKTFKNIKDTDMKQIEIKSNKSTNKDTDTQEIDNLKLDHNNIDVTSPRVIQLSSSTNKGNVMDSLDITNLDPIDTTTTTTTNEGNVMDSLDITNLDSIDTTTNEGNVMDSLDITNLDSIDTTTSTRTSSSTTTNEGNVMDSFDITNLDSIDTTTTTTNEGNVMDSFDITNLDSIDTTTTTTTNENNVMDSLDITNLDSNNDNTTTTTNEGNVINSLDMMDLDSIDINDGNVMNSFDITDLDSSFDNTSINNTSINNLSDEITNNEKISTEEFKNIDNLKLDFQNYHNILKKTYIEDEVKKELGVVEPKKEYSFY